MADAGTPRGSNQGLSLIQGHSAAQPATTKALPITSFNRSELTLLLNVYGRKVASGEWRDYAMDFLRDRALFSIYRHTSERPQFVVEKNPKFRNRQGQYLVTNQEGRVLKRGHDLAQVLRVFEPGLTLVK